jgi:hypothetical protein
VNTQTNTSLTESAKINKSVLWTPQYRFIYLGTFCYAYVGLGVHNTDLFILALSVMLVLDKHNRKCQDKYICIVNTQTNVSIIESVKINKSVLWTPKPTQVNDDWHSMTRSYNIPLFHYYINVREYRNDNQKCMWTSKMYSRNTKTTNEPTASNNKSDRPQVNIWHTWKTLLDRCTEIH